jgi:23S rRNA pseudouridine1911/1915/1917 synthase
VIDVDEPPPSPIDVPAEDIPLDIVYEDTDLLVLNKPPGLVIHPASGHPSGTLVNALLAHCDDLSGIGGAERPGIVHRLDRDTSGTMVVAKSERAHLGLSIAFRRRQVDKTYVAVCFGVPERPDGVIEGPVGRHPVKRQQMAVVESGRAARTLFTVTEEFTGTAYVECHPISGRTHQIRVHMAHIGHALVGDPLYAGRQWRSLALPHHQKACREFPRQALHARRLAFTHPVTAEWVEFETEPPADFIELIETLRTS